MKRPRMSTVTKITGVAAAAALLAGGAYAWAGEPVSTSDGRPGGGPEPTNLGLVKTEILEYYGDVEDEDGHHHASPDSDWAEDTARQIDKARRDLQRALDQDVRNPAIVLDVDDTSELTYGHNADHDFGYDPERFDEAIKNGEFPAIEPTVEFANFAAQNGVEVFFVTGRHEELRSVTLKNLASGGYPTPTEAVLKPDENPPDWLPCGLECTTVEYKSSARTHLEDAYDVTIVVNMGDQLSDLEGGHAENTVKLPNPMYFIP
ncbi:HAD family acid phosphatase [Actinophytocola sp.]|uniref:HAD family acid phosphatase n=1 Tax=Actinophytocola sp. TaxID=1872138 RepID=UPI003D6B25A0